MDYIPQFGGNVTQDISGYPADDAMAQFQLKRRLAQADALRNAKIPEGQMVSGIYVKPSWTQMASTALDKYQGGQQEKQAMSDYNNAQQAKQAKMREAALNLGKALDPQAITQQSTFDVQVPNGQTPTPMNKVGGMQPYESGMKTVSVPQTNTTGYRQPTSSELYNAIGEYSANTGNNDLLEKANLGRVTKKLDGGGKYSIHNIGNMGIELDENGRPTGTQYDYTSQSPSLTGSLEKDYTFARQNGYKGSIEDFKRIPTSWINPAQQKGFDIREEENNPLHLPKPSAQPQNSLLNPRMQTSSASGLSKGKVVNGFVYNGGNPNDPNSWRKQ